MKIVVGFLLVVALVGAVAVAVLEQNAIARTRAEHQALVSDSEEAQRLEKENKELAKLREGNGEVEKLREQNKELPKLRNEVRQLRRQAEELAALQKENQRLQARLQAGPLAGPAAFPPDFIRREAMVDAGLGTPEATVQTMFWATCQGNMNRVADCMMDGQKLLAQTSDSARTEAARSEAAKQMAGFLGFRIAERQDISADEVVLKLQASNGGAALPMKFRRTDGGWKLEQ